MPSLAAQLEPLTISQLRYRLCTFGCASTSAVEADAQRRGGRVEKKRVLVELLCRLHTEGGTAFQRRCVHSKGTPLGTDVLAPLLDACQAAFDHRAKATRARPGVQADGYLVLGVAAAGEPPRPLGRYETLWRLALAALHSAAPRVFVPTTIAVTKNFVGSPHVDSNDTEPQYALSLGAFTSGGELCVEDEDERTVHLVETRGRLACIDGRYPHWVRAFSGGDRYSVIFYRVEGERQEPCRAVLPPLEGTTVQVTGSNRCRGRRAPLGPGRDP